MEKQLSARELKELKRKRFKKAVVLPIRKLDESKQMKAEIGDQELSKSHKFALQQKYGLSSVLDTDIDWYLQEVLTRG